MIGKAAKRSERSDINFQDETNPQRTLKWAPCSSLYISGHPEKKTFAMEQVFRWTIGKRYC